MRSSGLDSGSRERFLGFDMGRIIKVCPKFVEFSGMLAVSIQKGDSMTTLMAIGGALDFEEPRIFQEFIQRAGGAKANIVVLPQASSLPETGQEYSQIFRKLGVKNK